MTFYNHREFIQAQTGSVVTVIIRAEQTSFVGTRPGQGLDPSHVKSRLACPLHGERVHVLSGPGPALVVVERASGTSRLVLTGHTQHARQLCALLNSKCNFHFRYVHHKPWYPTHVDPAVVHIPYDIAATRMGSS